MARHEVDSGNNKKPAQELYDRKRRRMWPDTNLILETIQFDEEATEFIDKVGQLYINRDHMNIYKF